MTNVIVLDGVHSDVPSMLLVRPLPYAVAGYQGPGDQMLMWTAGDWQAFHMLGVKTLTICALTTWPDGSHVEADIFDCETGNSPPSAAPAWFDAQKPISAARGRLPGIYSNQSTAPAIAAAMGPRVWLKWIAEPNGIPHLDPASQATQWKWTLTYDINYFVQEAWFGGPPNAQQSRSRPNRGAYRRMGR